MLSNHIYLFSIVILCVLQVDDHVKSQKLLKNQKQNEKQQQKQHTLEEEYSAFKRQKQVSVWRLTPETGTKLAFNARTEHGSGV